MKLFFRLVFLIAPPHWKFFCRQPWQYVLEFKSDHAQRHKTGGKWGSGVARVPYALGQKPFCAPINRAAKSEVKNRRNSKCRTSADVTFVLFISYNKPCVVL